MVNIFNDERMRFSLMSGHARKAPVCDETPDPSLTHYLTTLADRYEKGLIVYDQGLKTAAGAPIDYRGDFDKNL